MSTSTHRGRYSKTEIEAAAAAADFDRDALSLLLRPKSTDALEGLATGDLVRALHLIVRGMEKAQIAWRPEDINKHRSKYLAVAAELNQRKSIAPAFRPRLKPIRPGVRAPMDDLHSLDLQLIDLDWLAVHGKTSSGCGASAKFVFDDEGGLDWGMAWGFVISPWAMDKKVKALRLSQLEIWETGIIRPREVRDQLSVLSKEAGRYRLFLDGDCRSRIKGVRAVDVADWPELFLARRIVSSVLDLDDSDGKALVSPARVAEVYEKITGKLRDRRTIGTRMRRMMQHYSTRFKPASYL